MAKPRKLFSLCSLLMAFMFGFSSVQLDDPDWYFWFPLYACACVVNLLNWRISQKAAAIKNTAKAALWLGVFLFMKVVMEDFGSNIAGFWSLDLSERVVREKTGSAMVIISMILHLMALSELKNLKKRKKKTIGRVVEYGMAILVAFSYGLPFVFFVVQKGEMKF